MEGGAERKFPLSGQYKRPPGTYYCNNNMHGVQQTNNRSRVTCNTYGKQGHYVCECRANKRCYRCGSPQHQVRDCTYPPAPANQGPGGTATSAVLPEQGWASSQPKLLSSGTLTESYKIPQLATTTHKRQSLHYVHRGSQGHSK